MRQISFADCDITGGFWAQKQRLVRDVSIRSVYSRFCDTNRFKAFDFDWKEGMPDDQRPHIFWDSDIAKWLESAAYLIQKQPDAELESICDDTIAKIIEHQDKNGYFNIYFTVVEPTERFKRRGDHELYCAGHLIEAAVAYYKATGKRAFLDAMCRYADLIEKVFKLDRSAPYSTPGHEEIELALVKLADCTGDNRYLELSKFFIDRRGVKSEKTYDWSDDAYTQSHLPCREQRTAEGHSVRAVYLYSGMADIARLYGDSGLQTACEALFDNITRKRMYVTGGIGSTRVGEAFTIDYDLPNITAYTESCATLGLALFSRRMELLSVDSKYADTVERCIYNGFMSSLSLDGKGFFYENPLEVNPGLFRVRGEIHYPSPQRSEVFGCSCCPPNITRFIASVADFLYTADDDNGILFVNQYMDSVSSFSVGGESIKLTQSTDYPNDGKVTLTVEGGDITLAVRVPSWSDEYSGIKSADGYIYYEVSDGEVVSLDFKPEVRFISCDSRVSGNEGRLAVSYGPVVYCMEGVDNPSPLRDIRIDTAIPLDRGFDDSLGVPTLTAHACRSSAVDGLYTYKSVPLEAFTAKFIPYYAFANRGVTEMLIWTLYR